MSVSLRILLLIGIPIFIAACGLSVSDEERLRRAQQYIATGEFRTASIELKNVLANDPDNPQARISLARVSLGLGDVLDAEKEIRRAADLGAPDRDVRPLFLDVLIAQGRYADVLVALSDDPSGLTVNQAFMFRGAALYGIGSFEAAEVTYREWLSSAGANSPAIVGLARVLASTGRREEALANLNALLKDDPGVVEAWTELANIHFFRGEYEKAAAGFVRALHNSAAETDFRTYYLTLAALADSQLRAQKIDAGRTTLARLSAMAATAVPTLFLSARLAKIDQDYPASARYLQEVLIQSPNDIRALMFLADIQTRQNNLGQAAELLARVIDYTPDNIQARKLLARVQLRQSAPSGVVETLAPLLDGGDADVYSLIGQAHLQQGDVEEAIENFRMASSVKPDSLDEQLYLAVSYLAAGEHAMAIELLLGQPANVTGDYRREQLLMMAYARSGKMDSATAVANELKASRSSDSAALNLVAGFYLGTGDSDDARILYKKSLALDSENVPALLGLARLEMQAKNNRVASTFLYAVRDLQEGNPEAALGLARLAEIEGDPESVYRFLQEARTYHPDSVRLALALAQSYYRNGRADDALVAAREAATIGSGNPRINAAIGKTLLDSGAYEEALVSYELAEDRAPDSAQILTELGYAYLALDRTVDAQRSLSRAVAIDEKLIPAAAALILVELRQGRYNSALLGVRDLRQRLPNHVGVMLLEGEVYSLRGEHASAAEAYARAVHNGAGRQALLREYQSRTQAGLSTPESSLVMWLVERPADGQVRRLLAERYQTTGNSVQAIRQYEQVLTMYPNDAEVMNNLAWEYQKSGDFERARNLAERARVLQPDSGPIADTLGWIYLSLGAVDRSVAVLKEARALSPKNGEIHFHLATALSDSGQINEARDVLERLLANDSRFPSVEAASILLNELSSKN